MKDGPLILFAPELALLQDPETHYCNSLLLLLLGAVCHVHVDELGCYVTI